MPIRARFFLVFLGCVPGAVCAVPVAVCAASDPVPLTDILGPEIDAAERDAYRLFPDIQNFERARFYQGPDSTYTLEIAVREGSTVRLRQRTLPTRVFESARLHAQLLEENQALSAGGAETDTSVAEALRRTALRLAGERRYDVVSPILDDLERSFPQTSAGRWAADLRPKVAELTRGNPSLIRPGALLDQSGRNDLLIFSGYYGLWLGIAIPLALDAEDPEPYALGLLTAAPISIFLAHHFTRDHDIPEGQATIISLGGLLGAWQGIGWAAAGDADGNDAVGAGVLAGLAGIGAAVALTNSVEFTEGHAAITNAGMFWGAWYGLVAAEIADPGGESVLEAMLVGSDALVLGAGIAARGVRMSESRVRLMSLAGICGVAAGFGVDLLVRMEDEAGAFAVVGAGSTIGLALGATLTKGYDRPEPGWSMRSTRGGEPDRAELSGFTWDSPVLTLLRDPADPGRRSPGITLRGHFW